MILNLLTVTMFFAAGISLILGGYGGLFAFRSFRRWGRELTAEKRVDLEQRTYFILLVLTTVVIIRALTLPFFYLTLHSYIPVIPGAMCIFGVTQVMPELINPLQYFKFIVLFFCLAWLILNKLDNRTKYHPLMRHKLLFFSIISIPIVIDSISDLVLFSLMESPLGGLISCCTTVLDLPTRPSAIVAGSFFGPGYQALILPMYYTINIVLMAFIGFMLWKEKLTRKFQVAAVVLALLNVPIVLFAIIERIAPMMMALPYHHCVYCWWQYIPSSVILFAAFVLGVFGVWWAFTIELLGNRKETRDIALSFIKGLYAFALLCTLFSVIIVSFHLGLNILLGVA